MEYVVRDTWRGTYMIITHGARDLDVDRAVVGLELVGGAADDAGDLALQENLRLPDLKLFTYFLICARRHCAGAMLIFSVSFQL